MSFTSVTWYNPKLMVKVVGNSLPISHKKSRELARYIKYLPLDKAKKYLEEIVELKRPVPFSRYNRDVPHRKGIKGPVKSGRYPVKTAKYFLKLIDSLEKNAQFKGFDTSKLIILHVFVGKASKIRKKMRHRIVDRKNTHIEIVAAPIDSFDPNKRYKRKELEKMAKEFLKNVSSSE